MIPPSLRERLRSRDALHGLILKMPCAAEVELAARAADFIVLDLEHGPRDDGLLLEHLRAADAAGVTALVRVGAVDAVVIGSALDAGAAGVIAAHIETPDEAAALVAAARYPPEGQRGFARSTRAGGYGRRSTEEHLTAAREMCVVAQIESLEAAARAAAIAAVDGIDGLFPGAADIAVAAAGGDEGHLRVTGAVNDTLSAARGAGISGVAVAGGAGAAAALRRRGANVVIAVATTLIAAAFDAASAWNQASPTPPSQLPVVLVPGMLETAELWARVVDMLKPAAPSRPVRTDLDDTIVEMAKSVLAQAPARFVLWGHSLGGIVALEVLRRAPERAAAAVLVSASARPPTTGQRAAWAQMQSEIEAGRFDAIARDAANGAIGPAAADVPRLRDMAEAMAREIGPTGLSAQLRAQSSRTDLRAGLPAVSCPVLVVSGADDAVCPPERQAEIAAAIPGAEHVVLDGVGHLAPLEAPVELSRILGQWAGRTTMRWQAS